MGALLAAGGRCRARRGRIGRRRGERRVHLAVGVIGATGWPPAALY
ncbi:MAG: hypothetical protein H6644_10400 [Caldilineaceae bacterium]|nr:hypothetical protein [Caldilineaceae bacterium]